MGHRLDSADIHLLEQLDVVKHVAQFRAEPAFLLGTQFKPCQARDAVNVNMRSGHWNPTPR